jgi:GPH family glycoside/pentoside/hexuronide:cation symporter
VTSARENVSWGVRVGYAAPAFAMAVVGIPIYVYLPKLYTDVVGVEMATVGALLLGARVLDAVSDPFVGVLSDRTRSALGRRRPWIVGGALPLAVAIICLFHPPETGQGGAAWLGFWVFSVFVFWACVTVPYESLGPEITFDYDARTSLLAVRDGALILGTLAAAISPLVVEALLDLPPTPAGERSKLFWVAAAWAPLVVAACLWCAYVVREPSAASYTDAPRARAGIGDAMSAVRSNRPFAILLASYTVSALGSNLPATLILYYVEYVLEAPWAEGFLVLYFVTGVAFLPAWVWLARRIGKKTAWLASMSVNSGAFLGVFFLGPGDVVAYGVLVALSGTGFGATLAIASSMQADVIDYDELLSGRRREGLYVGIWSVARKLSAALGVGFALPLIGAAGYVPNAVQGPDVQLVLRALYALVPSLCNAAAIAIALAYPISRERHREILLSLGRAAEARAA